MDKGARRQAYHPKRKVLELLDIKGAGFIREGNIEEGVDSSVDACSHRVRFQSVM